MCSAALMSRNLEASIERFGRFNQPMHLVSPAKWIPMLLISMSASTQLQPSPGSPSPASDKRLAECLHVNASVEPVSRINRVA